MFQELFPLASCLHLPTYDEQETWDHTLWWCQCFHLPCSTIQLSLLSPHHSPNQLPHLQKIERRKCITMYSHRPRQGIHCDTSNITWHMASTMIYTPIDKIENSEDSTTESTELLSTLNCPRNPPHPLTRKAGAPVIILRNLSPPKLWWIRKKTKQLIGSPAVEEMSEGVTMCRRQEWPTCTSVEVQIVFTGFFY
jgi:hypothetical protein